MKLYTLDSEFLKKDVIDKFNSVIWTERYSDAGDVNLVLPANDKTVSALAEGTFLSEASSREVMEIQTQEINKGMLTVTGSTLPKFLNNRVIRTSPNHEDQEWNLFGMSASEIIATIVSSMCISGSYVDSDYALIDGPKQIIPGLTLGDIDTSGDDVNLLIPYGPIFDSIQNIAKTFSLGFTMYLAYATPDGYSLVFTVYKGRDLTREQMINDVVQFSPNLDSLTNTKEIRSISGYKNVAYIFAAGNPDDLATVPGIAYADPESEDAIGFNRRVMMVMDYDVTSEMIGGDPAILLAILNQKARDALANNNYVKVLDGEIVPQSEFKYGIHYKLGDIIELQSLTGFWQRARVTEYIRTQDERGERAYPTVSVIS